MSLLDEAIVLVKAAGYRVSKPKAKAKPNRNTKDRVGPTCVATFADGQTTKMSTYTSPENLDWDRGVRLSQAAWEARWRRRARFPGGGLSLLAPVPPTIIAMHFEWDGVVLARRSDSGGAS